jgi:hypothetical protein
VLHHVRIAASMLTQPMDNDQDSLGFPIWHLGLVIQFYPPIP